MKATRTLVGCLAGGLLALTPAFADVSPADMQIVARALSFLEKPPVGDVNVGIVYSPANAQSAREAEAVQRLLGGGLKVGNLTLRPLLISIADIQRADVKLLFLTAGLDQQAKLVGAASARLHVPCVTTDLSQVRGGVCTMGIRSQPKIEILVNRTAAADSHTTFSTVFRMMITEI